jgi:hypothetical protein
MINAYVKFLMEVFMTNRKIIGLILLIASPLSMLCWFLTPGSSADQADTMAMIMAAGQDPDGMKLWGLLAMVCTIFYVTAFTRWAKHLESESLGALASVGRLHMKVGLAVAIGQVVFMGVSAKAASAGATQMTSAAEYWGASIGFGSAGLGIMFLGTAVISIVALLQKVGNPIILGGLAVVSLVGVYGCAFDYSGDIMMVPYMGSVLFFMALGATLLRD